MPLITSFFSVATPEEAAEQATRGFEEIRHASQWETARKILSSASTVQRERQSNTERQQRRRLRIKETQARHGLRDRETLKIIKPMKLRPPSPDPPALPPVVENSINTSEPSKSVKRRAPRTNWYEPSRWTLIDTAAKRVGFSPSAIAHELKRGLSGALFKTIDRGTIGPWINDNHNGWTDAVVKRVERAAEGKAPRVVGADKQLGRRQRLLPWIIAAIIMLLTTMRAAGTLITRAVAQSVVMAFIRINAPELFDDPTFKCSDSFVRSILRDKLDWSWRAVTQAAQKLPSNWLQQCLDFGHRLTWLIALNNVPPELVINADQTGISYLGTGSRTWELKGASQVQAVGKGEKRQFTLMVAVASSGEMLPFQAIYKGKTKQSIPSEHARKPCESIGFVFTPGGEKHWSTLEAMKVWVKDIIVKYADKKRRQLGLPATQKVILILDCWAVHRGEPFQVWMKKNHSSIILLFVPGGCTSVAQPCDTRINRILKHLVKTACVEYLSQETQRQLQNGISASEVEINTTPGVLRDASTGWLLNAWRWFQDHPEAVRDAWRDTRFGDWDLSYDTLTSARCRTVVHERFMEDTAFSLAISSQLPSDPDFVEANSLDYDDDCAINPSVLCDIRGRLPANMIEREGSLEYIGDEE